MYRTFDSILLIVVGAVLLVAMGIRASNRPQGAKESGASQTLDNVLLIAGLAFLITGIVVLTN